ncbi:MAG: hypothetical protein ACI3ZP_12025 [Candidatus Cryptobacteroides sp.]
MKNCHTGGEVNILAFFNVVASRQISPLSVFGAQIYCLPAGYANFSIVFAENTGLMNSNIC